MKRKLISSLLACALFLSFSTAAGAADIDAAGTGADTDAAIVAADYPEVGGELEPGDELPSAYSSVDAGYVTPARKQLFNTCWAYSSTATLESLILKNNRLIDHLSTMHMNFSSCTLPDGKGWQRSYSDAGYPYISLGYLTSFGSLPDGVFPEDLTYDDYIGRADDLYPTVIADSVIYLNANDRETIKTAVYEYGGVVANFHYDSSAMYNNSYCSYVSGLPTNRLNGHAIEIVGWDDGYGAENFHPDHQPENNGAWLCKNSWGPDWGENGLFRISYDDLYIFDSRFGPSYAITHARQMTAIDKVQQNETFGAVCEFDYLDGNSKITELTYVNILDLSDGYHNIDKVVFESESQGSSYTVFYIPLLDDGTPDTDSANWTELASGTIDYQGYIGANVGGFDAPAEKIAIGVRIERTNDEQTLDIGISEWLRVAGNYRFLPQTEAGQCYILGINKKTPIIELMDFYKTYLSDDIGSTFVIKALCSSDEVKGDVDRDESFTIVDVTLTQRKLIEITELDKKQLRFADYDNDGFVDVVDCTRMQRRLVDLDIDLY